MSAHGIDFRTLDLQNAEFNVASVWFDLTSGYAEPPPVRGANVVLPSAVGRVWMPKVNDQRIIEIAGFVRGLGSSLEERQEDWREQTDALMAVMQFDDEPGPFQLHPPYLGLESSVAIDAVAINTVGGPVLWKMTFQRWSIQLEAPDPIWTSGSS